MEPAQTPSRARVNLCRSSQSQGQKRKRGLEEEESDIRQQGLSSSTDKPAAAFTSLSKKNLAKLNKLNRQEDSKKEDSKGSCGMVNKKRSYSRSSVADTHEDATTTVSTSTHKSSLSLSNYRLINLARQKIVFQHKSVPEHIQTRLDSIFHTNISEDDRSEVTSIAKSLCDDFADVLKAACHKDDFVGLIYQALGTMNKRLLGQNFALRRKAGRASNP